MVPGEGAAGLALQEMATLELTPSSIGAKIDADAQAGLLCLAVEQAFRHSNRAVALAALETLLVLANVIV